MPAESKRQVWSQPPTLCPSQQSFWALTLSLTQPPSGTKAFGPQTLPGELQLCPLSQRPALPFVPVQLTVKLGLFGAPPQHCDVPKQMSPVTTHPPAD